jgi:hypothetical protein
MTQLLESTPQIIYLPNLERSKRRQLLRAFWMIALGLFVYELFFTQTKSLENNFNAVLITAAALLPSYLWCSGRALGLPIFPFFALTYIWTHALPLVSNYQSILVYSTNNQIFASLTVAGFLGLGTLVWFQFTKSTPKKSKSYRTLNSKKSNQLFLLILFIAVFFNTSLAGGWFSLDGGIFAIFRGAVLGLTAISVFLLGYRLGAKELSTFQSRLFVFLLIAYTVTNAISLLLVTAASTFLIVTLAFIIGSKKIPVLPIIIIILSFSLLHYGKGDMRAKYWYTGQTVYIQPWEYPSFYTEWLGYSFDYINKRDDLSKSQKKQSLIERSSLVQMLLLAQDKSPSSVPFLSGETYAIIPELLVPRIFNSNKIISNTGTNILSVHYGLQTPNDTKTTTISWGLLAESYANFGLFGCGGLAIILGVVYGKITRWSMNAPIISAQSLFTVLMMTFALQTDFSAGVYVSALFQSSVVLAVIVLVFMKKYPSQRSQVLSNR